MNDLFVLSTITTHINTMSAPWPPTGAAEVQNIKSQDDLPEIRSTTPGSILQFATGTLIGRRNFDTTKARNAEQKEKPKTINLWQIIKSYHRKLLNDKHVYVPIDLPED